MSSFAKKMLEKYGWKEGEGLGKSREGVKTHIKVVRRDPHTAAGLGHLSDPSVLNCRINMQDNSKNNNVYSSEVVELDSIYSSLAAERKHKRKRENNTSASRSSSSNHTDHCKKSKCETALERKELKSSNDNIDELSSSSSSYDSDNSNSNSSLETNNHYCNNDDKSSTANDKCSKVTSNKNAIKRTSKESTLVASPTSPLSIMSDEELFRKCGGVRLGRAGRHRFFDGKLKRINESN